MATAGNQGGGQTGWREGKSVESVWGPGSFGVQDCGGSSQYNVGNSQTNAGGSCWGSNNGGSSNRSCESWQEALLKSVQK